MSTEEEVIKIKSSDGLYNKTCNKKVMEMVEHLKNEYEMYTSLLCDGVENNKSGFVYQVPDFCTVEHFLTIINFCKRLDIEGRKAKPEPERSPKNTKQMREIDLIRTGKSLRPSRVFFKKFPPFVDELAKDLDVLNLIECLVVAGHLGCDEFITRLSVKLITMTDKMGAEDLRQVVSIKNGFSIEEKNDMKIKTEQLLKDKSEKLFKDSLKAKPYIFKEDKEKILK